MKILFLFQGTTHYYNLITSQINNQPGVEIVYVFPASKDNSIWQGVFQTQEGVNFQLVGLEEMQDISTGNYYFPELDKFILETRPDIILTTEAHINGIFLDKKIRAILKQLHIKIILKSIPFENIKKYEDRIREFKNKLNDNLLPSFNSMPGFVSKWMNLLKLNLLYKKFYLDRKAFKKYLAALTLQKEVFNFVDAHVNYIDKAYDIFESYDVPKDKIFITYNSPDTDLYFSVKKKIENEPAILPVNRFRIIHLSRLVEWKRVDMLINAVANLKKEFPAMELLIIGNGPEKDKLMEQAVNLQVSESVKFIGGVYDPELLGKYLMSSSIYTLAGMGGLSINDAMIFGLPVICSVCDGTEKYLVKEGYNGLYFEKGNQNSLELKIKYLFNNPDTCVKMGQHSVQIIKDEINIHTVVEGYMKAFNYVLQGNNQA